MADRVYTGPSEATSKSSEDNPSITTLAGIKKETHTAVYQYFAPVVALYNVVASTAGLPTIRWEAQGQNGFHQLKGQSDPRTYK
jgi:hypothetical protein